MEQVMPMLEKLATALNTKVEYLWDVLVRQAMVEGVLGIVWAIVCVGIVIFGVKWLKYARGKRAAINVLDWDPRESWNTLAFAIGCPAILIGIVCTFCNIHTVIVCLLNPEYWALKQVLKLF